MTWFTDDRLDAMTKVYGSEAPGSQGHSIAMLAHELIGLRAFLERKHALYAAISHGGGRPQVREHIVAAAVMSKDGQVYTAPPPARHNDIMQKMPSGTKRDCVFGFKTSSGVFLERGDALLMAKRCNQVISRCGGDETALFSENCW